MAPLSQEEQAWNVLKSRSVLVLTTGLNGFAQSLWIIRQQLLNSVNYKLFLINFALCLQLRGRLGL